MEIPAFCFSGKMNMIMRRKLVGSPLKKMENTSVYGRVKIETRGKLCEHMYTMYLNVLHFFYREIGKCALVLSVEIWRKKRWTR